MLTPPEGYRDAMAAGNPIHIKMEYSNGVTLTDEDIDLSTGVTLTDAFNPDTDIRMGRASCRQLTTRILITDKTRYMQWSRPFDLSFGVEDGEGGTIWVYFGTFIGQRPRNTTTVNAIDYTAYDQMSLFDNNADDYLDEATFSKTVSTMLSEIASEVGVNIITTGALANALSRNMASNRFTKNNYTFRDLLDNLAESCACYARIGGADMDKVELVFFDLESNPRIVTRDEIFYEEHADLYDGLYWNDFDEYTWNEADEMTWNEVSGYYKDTNSFVGVYCPKIDGGVIGRYPSNVKTGHIYEYKDNPIMKISNKTTAVTNYVKPVYDRLITLGGVLPMSVECVGDLITQAGDVIHVELPEGIVDMPIYYKTMTWNGMLVDRYETTAPDA